ncbi:MAG: hypothetical protein ACI9B9_002514 [Halioglobus sp.]|jgi:hypothetical protein
MNEVFVIRNQLGHYWGKKKLWVDGSDNRTVMRLRHRDEAVNSLFELSSKDFELRGEIVEAQLSAKGEPEVEASDIPLPDAEVDETLATEQIPQPAESSAAGA